MADPIPTRFRIIFTRPRNTMTMALRRIEKAFGANEAPLRNYFNNGKPVPNSKTMEF
ncbi:hypothetical protein K438DRAFT_1858195 [Mycena galopus ATCC 62051]|nr:hypothetical protein K438DRAFT_1858195 [Mycena galopus ATCC 62051]